MVTSAPQSRVRVRWRNERGLHRALGSLRVSYGNKEGLSCYYPSDSFKAFHSRSKSLISRALLRGLWWISSLLPGDFSRKSSSRELCVGCGLVAFSKIKCNRKTCFSDRGD